MGFWAAMEEIYPSTRQQRCWCHKTRNVLNGLTQECAAESQTRLAGYLAERRPKSTADQAFDVFLKTYEPKYPKATACLQKDREQLLTFYAFPARHWQSLHSINPIESTFGTIRHRTKQTNGCLTRDGLLHMMFKLGQCAEKTWRRLRGFRQLAQVIEGIQFDAGFEETTIDPVAA